MIKRLTESICTVENCKNKSGYHGPEKNPICATHYVRWKRHGDINRNTKRGRSPINRKCSIESCASPHFAKGLCSTHYQYQWRTGYLEKPIVTCSVDGCTSKAKRKGFCENHKPTRKKEKIPKPKKETMNEKKKHLKLVPKTTELPPMPLQFMNHPTFGKGLVIADQGESILIKFSDGTQRRIYKQYLYPCKGDE